MNIQYENEEDMTLVGSFRSQQPSLNDIEFQKLNKNKTPENQMPKQIVHKVTYGDTLQGISLTYDVSIFKIKQRNKLQSDSIYYLKEIIIPDPKIQPPQAKQLDQFMKVQQFVLHMSAAQKSPKTARYYLTQNDWNVQKAVAEYRRDLEWQKNNKLKSYPIAFYNPIELMTKKKK